MTLFLVSIENFYPSSFSDRTLRLASSEDNYIDGNNKTWVGGMIDIDSITPFRIELNEDRPHAALRIYAKNDAITNVFRNFLGFPDVDVIEIERS